MIDPGGLANLGEWIRTGTTAGVLAVMLGFWLKKRKDDREGWGALIDALTKDVRAVREEHQECQRRLTDVESQLRGVHRQLVMQSSNAAISLAQPSADVAGAAGRAKRIVDDGP